MSKRSPVALAFAATVATLLVTLAPAIARDWVEYKSQNFTLLSDTDEEQARAHLESFEAFRLVALAMLGANDRPEPVHPLLMLFESTKDWSNIQPDRAIAGFFHNSIFGPRMFIAPQQSPAEAQGVLFHEYVHYLMDRHSLTNYPRWFGEGYAELLAGVRIEEQTVVVGAPSESMRLAFPRGNALQLADIIDLKRDAGFEFYMKSWIFVHYLLLESVPNTARWQQTLEYLRKFDAGEDPVAAFEQAFGTTPREMDRTLNAYKERNALSTLTMRRLPYTGGIERRVLSEAEALYRLGDVTVDHNQLDAAYKYFNDLEDIDDTSPLAIKARSRRAIALVHDERMERGDEIIEPLVASGVTDAEVLTDIAHYAFDRAVFEKEKKRAYDGHLARSLDFGKRAVAGNPLDVEAHFYLGLAHELGGDFKPAIDALLDAYEINPTDARVNRNLARVLIKDRELEVAAQIIQRLFSATHSDELREKLKELEELVRSGEVEDEDLKGVLE